MSQNSPFFIPNLDKNFTLEEKYNGLEARYVLACDHDYPYKTFTTKKSYVSRSAFIPYQNNMSDKIMRVYLHLKNSTMLELALWKHQQITQKIIKLQANLNILK